MLLVATLLAACSRASSCGCGGEGPAPEGREGQGDVVVELAVVDEAITPYDETKVPDTLSVGGRGWTDAGAHLVSLSVRVGERETDDAAVARAKPWFDAVALPPNRRFAFGVLGRPSGAREVDVHVIEVPSAVVVRAGDVVCSEVGGVVRTLMLRLTSAARARLERESAALVGKRIAILSEGRALWAPGLHGPFGARGEATLAFVGGAVGIEEARAERFLASLPASKRGCPAP